MKKNLSWDLKINGTRHQVECFRRGSNFEVYVDGEYRFSVRSDESHDQEMDVTIGGKLCRFVVCDGLPDLEVDGILLNAEADFLKKEKRDRYFSIFFGVLLTVVGTFAVFSGILLKLAGEEFYGGWFTIVMAVAITLLGIWQIIHVLRNRPFEG